MRRGSCSRTSRDKPYENPNPNRETPAGVHTLIEASNTQPLPPAQSNAQPKGNPNRLQPITNVIVYDIPHGTSAAHAKVAAEAEMEAVIKSANVLHPGGKTGEQYAKFLKAYEKTDPKTYKKLDGFALLPL